MKKYEVDLSIVIITRNEEEMIEDCIRSALASAELAVSRNVIRSFEILHIDSASTDRTVEFASKYPVRILQLPSSSPLSASAGLYTGFKHARGKYFMNLGGDMQVKKNWISNAVPHLLKADRIAGVTGFEEEHLEGKGYLETAVEESIARSKEPGFTEYVGIAIYKMEVLRKVGGYNPFLKGGEDTDLSFRILSNDYKIVRIPDQSVVHFWSKRSGKLKFGTILKSTWTWSLGDGQSTRYSLYDNSFVKRQKNKYFRARQLIAFTMFLAIITVAGLNMLIFTFGKLFILLVIILDITSILFVLYHLQRNNWDSKIIFQALSSIPYFVVSTAGFIRGYTRRPRSIDSYPADVKEIKNRI